MEEMVREMLQHRKQYEGERNILDTYISVGKNTPRNEKTTRLAQLNQHISMVDGWLYLLSEDEAFVVKRHLIDGIDWPRITHEYASLWGAEFARAERTLRSYQQKALSKIVKFVSDNPELLN